MNKFCKYLLCIFFSILAINFIVSIISFFKFNSSYLVPAKITANPKDESIIEMGKDLEKEINKQVTDLKDTHGEDYPALGVIYYNTIAHYSSVTLVQNFIFSLIAGFGLGNIIFLLFISGLSKYKLTLALILALFVTAIFLALSDIYTYLANSEELKFGMTEILWNMEVTAIPYFIATLLLMAGKKVYKTYREIRYS